MRREQTTHSSSTRVTAIVTVLAVSMTLFLVMTGTGNSQLNELLNSDLALGDEVATALWRLRAGEETNRGVLRGLQKQIDERKSTSVAKNLTDLNGRWSTLASALKNVEESIDGESSLQRQIDLVRTAQPELRAQVQALAEELSDSLDQGSSSSWSGTLSSWMDRSERLERDVTSLLSATDADRVRYEQRISQIGEEFRHLAEGMERGDKQKGLPQIISALPDEQKDAVARVIVDLRDTGKNISTLLASSRAARAYPGVLNNALTENEAVKAALRQAWDSANTNKNSSWVIPCLLLLVMIGVLRLWWIKGRKVNEVDVLSTRVLEAPARDQQAIMRLLNEISSLAEGDLTVRASVSEDVTGAIADAINYAIEALRGLVGTIGEAATELDEATRRTQATARHLAQASESQTKQVFAATKSISEMAESIERVSEHASRSTKVAQQAVDLAGKGDQAVRRTIDGMNTIRETIQETSKRIKRLGESSQEIGNIVELISDIAEQTNILALNASIQASMAGEAGKGFAVVAEEVQRLAERAGQATKQIEVLVRTIQSDTNEAVVSMERSTTDVVSGAMLAENAGKALSEIATVSDQIAKLVTRISENSRQQALAAADLTRNTGVLQEISSQTAESSSATSTAIAKLAKMAGRLRESVAGFRLRVEQPPPGSPESQESSRQAEQKGANAPTAGKPSPQPPPARPHLVKTGS